MRLDARDPPREFRVGRKGTIKIRDCGTIELQPNEQMAFVTSSGAQYDVCRKDWGFYATPSLNGRLRAMGLRALLVQSPESRYYLWMVEAGREPEMERYLRMEGHRIVCWLDSDEALKHVDEATSRA